MKLTRALVGGLILMSLSGCMGESKIPIMSYDKDGNPTQVMVAEGEYSGQVTEMISATQDSAAPIFSRQNRAMTEGLSRDSVTMPAWMLRTVIVGTGVSMEIGVDPIWKVGVYPRFRMVFSNSIDPTIP